MNKFSVLFISFALLFLVASCGRSEEVSSDKLVDIIPVDYEGTVNRLDQKLREELTRIGLDFEENQFFLREEVGEKKVGQYNFSWITNYHKLEVPLFGEKGQLLPFFKDEIVAELEKIFPLVEVQWEDNEGDRNRRLKVDLSFRAQNGGLEVLAHSLELIQKRPKAKMAIIIDDLGYARRGTEEIMSINYPLTMAVLPYLPYSVEQANWAKDMGHEVILHQPLEPTNPEVDPGDGAIYTDMSRGEIRDTLIENLDSLPKVIGVNHHMGSKGSADERVMNHIMEVLRERDLYYVDSSTAKDSAGLKTARGNGIPTGANYLFLDNIDDKEEIKKMFHMLAKIALDRGDLITIGHIRRNTALAIEETIPKLEEMGIKLVYASQILR